MRNAERNMGREIGYCPHNQAKIDNIYLGRQAGLSLSWSVLVGGREGEKTKTDQQKKEEN